MDAFRDVIECSDVQLDGTVIRIPLRTAAHAKKSNICNRETTISELRKVMHLFASEFGENGLLFMKNVEKLEMTANGLAISIAIADSEAVQLWVSCNLQYITAHLLKTGRHLQTKIET